MRSLCFSTYSCAMIRELGRRSKRREGHTLWPPTKLAYTIGVGEYHLHGHEEAEVDENISGSVGTH